MTQPRSKVIIADDDRVIRHIFKHLLISWGYEPIEAQTGAEAMAYFEAHNPVLMILDWEMPGLSGVEVCKRIRATDRDLLPYIILVSSHADMSYVATALHLGADDFISKPVNPSVLRARIEVGARAFQLQRDLLDAQRRLEFQAAHDSLTGLANRRAILQRLKIESLRVQNSGEKLLLGICDIDYFKPINDVYGHPVGDRILVEFARRIETCFRPYDLMGRWGGEEFIIAMSTSDVDHIRFYERLRESVEETPFLAQDLGLSITVSVGIALYNPEQFGEVPDIDDLLSRADEALYKAKNSGRNRVCESEEVSTTA